MNAHRDVRFGDVGDEAISARTKLRDIPGFSGVLTASFAAFAGWSLLLPVIPLAVARGGGSPAQAGAATTVFMAATVVAQVFVPRLLRRWGYRPVLTAGCLLLATPCVVMMLRTPLIWWYLTALLRGLGFGLLTVAATALVGRLSPQWMLGRATGIQGAVIGLATAVSLPGGLVVVHTAGLTAALSLGAALPIISIAGLWRLPALRETPMRRDTAAAATTRVRVVTSSAIMALAGAGFGCATTLLPIGAATAGYRAEVLMFLVGALSMAGRYGAGFVADRYGAGRALVAALLLAAASLVALGVGVWGSLPGLLGVAAATFGLAYGAIQTESMVLTYLTAGAGGVAMGSTYYNIGVDLGIGVGSLTQGAVAGVAGLPVALATGGSFAAVAILPAIVTIRHSRSKDHRHAV